MLALYEDLAVEGISVPFTLTDKYPSIGAFRRLSSMHPATIFYFEEPVDATSVPAYLTGVRTMFNAFHHFAPMNARSVLECAAGAGQPIGIFEIPERTLATILPLICTPIFVWIATPFIRPFLWRRLFWTYLLPLVPLTCWWDGLVSQLRAYTVEEMMGLTRGLSSCDWTAARVEIGGTGGHVTYLIGIPKSSRS